MASLEAQILEATAQQVPAASPALPLLRTVLKNLASDPTNEKFRSINLSGKAGLKLVAEPAAMTTLSMVGFKEVDGRLVIEGAVDTSRATTVANALSAPAAPALARPAAAPTQFNLDGTPKQVVKETGGPVSMKQQARRKAEEQALREKAEAKRQREETKKQIERDNYARKHDENWKTTEGVTKGGKDINTFRGKYGEEGGG